MDFMNALKNNEKALTANGATMYKTSRSALVDINFKVPKLRVEAQNNFNTPYLDFDLAYNENPNYALRWLLYLRDVRGGLGERTSFRYLLNNIAKTNPQLMLNILNNIPIAEFGRWDDVINILNVDDGDIQKAVIKIIVLQLSEDVKNMKDNKPISLLGKWLPSQNASSKKTKRLGCTIAKQMRLSSKQYRKLLTTLRKYIDIVETHLTDKEYQSINYEAVPSKANIKYRNAFLRNDSERRLAFLEALKKGEVKINATSQFPHDIVNAYDVRYWAESKIDDTLEAMWKAQKITETYSNTLIVRDGSGSMSTSISQNSKCCALDVSTALAILCSEHNTGAYKDKFITFSSRPKLVDLSQCNSLFDKLQCCSKEDDCSNTDLEATFNLILNTAVKNNMTQDDMPERIVVISDMQFDQAQHHTLDKTLMETISDKFTAHGYKMPKLIFWNCSQYGNNGVPMQENELGVILMSGYSIELLNFITSNAYDPLTALKEILDSPRYDVVDNVIPK